MEIYTSYQSVGCNYDLKEKPTATSEVKQHNSGNFQAANHSEIADASKKLSTVSSYPRRGLKNNTPFLFLVFCGLFFAGTEDKVVCYACGATMSDWKDNDELLDQHRKQSPYCHKLSNNHQEDKELRRKLSLQEQEKVEDTAVEEALRPAGNHLLDTSAFPIVVKDSATALGLIQGDIDIGTRDTIIEKRSNLQTSPETPDYTIEANRLDTFRDVWSDAYPVKARDLARAGLYFTGPNDRVQCAFCRGGLYQWEEGDSPLTEHRKHFPQCGFIQDNFDSIMQVHLSPESSTDGPSSNSSATAHSSSSPATVSKQIAHNLGYPMDEVESALIHLQQNGINPSVSNLLDVLFDNSTDPSPLESQACAQIPSENSLSNQPTTQPDIQSLKEENTALSERVTCKVCLSENVVDVFLPCRHLVCCEKCSKAVNKCPLCRTKISATIKAFMS